MENDKKIYVSSVDVDNNGLNIANATKTGYLFCPVGGVYDMSYPNSKLRRGRVQEGGEVCPTLTCAPDNIQLLDSIEYTNDMEDTNKKVKNIRIRKLTERECFRLMGLKDEEIDKILDSSLCRTRLYKMAGNSICVPVLTNIFRTMFIDKNSEVGQSNKLF